MDSEDLEGDSSESKIEAIEKENPKGDQKEKRREFVMQDDQTRGPEGLAEKMDSVEKRGESETGVTRWRLGRCDRMCRGT